MQIVFVGATNVGKTTVGALLAQELKLPFFDLDSEVVKRFNTTLEDFVHTNTLLWRDSQRASIIRDILQKEAACVLAISPMSYIDECKDALQAKDVLVIELIDSDQNIFDRLVFSDENDQLYIDGDTPDGAVSRIRERYHLA